MDKRTEQKQYIELQKQCDLLLELCKDQNETLKFINKIMFETTKYQLNLDKEKQNFELLDLAWSTNDVVCDNPRKHEIIKTLEESHEVKI